MAAYEPTHPAQLTQRLKNAPSIKSVLELHRTSDHRYNQIHLSATWIALAKHAAGRPMPPRLLADLAPLLEHSRSMVAAGAVEQRQLSNVVYGIARCGIASGDAPEVFNELAAAAEAIAPGCSPQNLCNILWAFSTAGHVSPRVFLALAAAATERTEAHWRRSRDDEGFNPQSLSNTVWAVAKAGVRDPALFDALAPIAVSQMHL